MEIGINDRNGGASPAMIPPDTVVPVSYPIITCIVVHDMMPSPVKFIEQVDCYFVDRSMEAGKGRWVE